MGRFAIMPVVILENTEINDSEKLLFMLISGLSEKCGFCYATNEYLATERNCSSRTIQRQLKKLESLKLINIDMQSDGCLRRIFVVLDIKGEASQNDGNIDSDTNVMGGDTSVMGGDKNVAGVGVSTDKKINNKNKYKEKEIYKEKESPTFIKLPLKDGEDFCVTEEYVSELIASYPDKAVSDELKLMRAWLLDKQPKDRKTVRGIHRFICSWLRRSDKIEIANSSEKAGTEIDRTKQYIKEQDEAMEKNKNGYAAYLAMREKRTAVNTKVAYSPFHPGNAKQTE